MGAQAIGGLAVGAVIGALLGAVLVWRRLVAERDGRRSEVAELRIALAGATKELELRQRSEGAEEALSEHLSGKLSEVAMRLYKDQGEAFMSQATATFDERRRQVDDLLAPVRETLDRLGANVGQIEARREEAYRSLTDQVRSLMESGQALQGTTASLVTALRSSATRGTWGEVQLRRVVELAGMVDHCDFDEQATLVSDDGVSRPDMVVRLPGGRSVVVDAKAPMAAYLRSMDEAAGAGRTAALAEHAKAVRAHVDALAKRAYWRHLSPSPEFVVAFLPGDALLAAAFEAEPGLLDYATSKGVLIATPVTLIALLKAISYGWGQEAVARSAAEIQEQGKELYRRLATFAEHLDGVGQGLGAALRCYNSAVGSFESRLIPGARRFAELNAIGDDAVAKLSVAEVTSEPRALRSGAVSGLGGWGLPGLSPAT